MSLSPLFLCTLSLTTPTIFTNSCVVVHMWFTHLRHQDLHHQRKCERWLVNLLVRGTTNDVKLYCTASSHLNLSSLLKFFPLP